MANTPSNIYEIADPQPEFDSGAWANGVSDIDVAVDPNALTRVSNAAKRIDVQEIAYGKKFNITDLAYGGNNYNQTLSAQSSRIGRIQRGIPRLRRGTLVPAIPRTKAQTIYARDPGQGLANKLLSTGATGVANSGAPAAGTSNQPNLVTGAINRYRTDYPTLIQPAKNKTVIIV